MLRSRNYCFTAFIDPIIDTSKVKYYIYQKEKCPESKKIHWQGYIELIDKLSLKQVKTIFNDNTIHLEIRKGSQEQAIGYCQKIVSKVGKCKTFGTPKKQGKRSDLDEMAEVAPYTSIKRMIQTYGGNALRHIHMIKTYQRAIFDPDPIERYLQNNERIIDENMTADQIANMLIQQNDIKVIEPQKAPMPRGDR